MASGPNFSLMQVVPPNGEETTPVMTSLCRSLALVNAVAFFLESLKPGIVLPDHEREDFVLTRISAFATNVYMVTDADAEQARRDLEQLSLTLGIQVLNIPMAKADGMVN